jgi:hypothetical protein
MFDEEGNRNAVLIACEIVKMIPETEVDFIADMRKLLVDFAYVSPERQYAPIYWYKLDLVMKRYIPDMNGEPWKTKIIEIFVGTSKG